MTNVFLVRHGQASAGTDNYDRLSQIGIQQSTLLGERWREQQFHIDAAYSGTLQRQQHTAELVLKNQAKRPEMETLEGLNEYDHTTVDRLYGNGATSSGAEHLTFDQYFDIMKRWQDASVRPVEEVLSYQEFSMQGWLAIQNAVQAYTNRPNAHINKHANLVFFTSGGVIATILQQLLSLNFESTMHAVWQIRNASLTSLLFNRHGVCLVDYNTIAHLPAHANSELVTLI